MGLLSWIGLGGGGDDEAGDAKSSSELLNGKRVSDWAWSGPPEETREVNPNPGRDPPLCGDGCRLRMTAFLCAVGEELPDGMGNRGRVCSSQGRRWPGSRHHADRGTFGGSASGRRGSAGQRDSFAAACWLGGLPQEA